MKITIDIINAVKAADTVLVCGHIRPDGDCVSSATAMGLICEKLGKKVDVTSGDGEKPENMSFLPRYDRFCELRYKKYDLFIAVDCATVARLGDNVMYLNTAKNSVCIDHHPTNERYGKINYVDASASSTCAILYDIFKDENLIDKDIATALYSGLSTDTGHFMHSNTDAKTFGIARELAEFGFDIGEINHCIYGSNSLKKTRLTARALDSIRLYEGGKIALMVISREDLAACECTSLDTEGLIDNASNIAGVEISISMCEQPGAIFRVSFRSRHADVAAAAAKFGGGGHKLAAGCIVAGNRFDVADKLIAAASSALKA